MSGSSQKMSRSSSSVMSDCSPEFSNVLIEELSERLTQNESSFDENQIKNWKMKLVDLMEQGVTLKFKVEEQRKLISEIGSGRLPEKSTADENVSLTQQTEIVRELLKKRTQGFNPENTEKVKKLKEILYPRDQDEDINEVRSKAQETDFKCPVTGIRFDKPMKNLNCKHHISKAGLDLILRRTAEAKCPIPGCSNKWTASSSSLDKEFDLRMERFFRQEARTNQLFSQLSQAEALDVDEGEE